MSLNLPAPAQPVFERHRQDDQTHAAHRRGRAEQAQEARAALEFARASRDTSAAHPQVTRAEVARLDAEVEKRREALAKFQTPLISDAMTAVKLERVIAERYPLDTFISVSRPNVLADPAALKRTRTKIAARKAERKEVAAAPKTLAEVRADLRDYVASLENAGRVNTLSMFYGGEPEFPSARLPGRSPSINRVPDGVAFAVFGFGVDTVMERLAPFLEFNAPPNALSSAEKAKRLAAIDAELEKLGREEAAMVEGIVADGGTAHHLLTADPLHVLGIAVAA